MSSFSVVPELRIGSVVEVAGTDIRVELDGEITELTRTYAGRVYPVAQYASVVKVHYARRVLLAYVRLLRMRSELAREEGVAPPPPSEDSRIVEADLFGEGTWDPDGATFAFRQGVRTYPLPGQPVYLTTQEELRHIYESAEAAREGGPDPMVQIGSYVGTGTTGCYANIDKLFGLHCAVLGSTGAGKSAAVAAVLRGVIEHRGRDGNSPPLRPRVVVIDPHAEYPDAFKGSAIVYRAYNVPSEEPEAPGSPLRLPYWLMTGEEFRDLVIGKTEYEATSENNIVLKALTHARLVKRGWVERAQTWAGRDPHDTDRPGELRPTAEEHHARIAEYDRDTPDPFSLVEFAKHVEDEQGVRRATKAWERLSFSDFKSHASVLDKLRVLRSDPRLSFMMAEHGRADPDLPDVLAQFVGQVTDASSATADIRIVDISGLPNEVAGPLTAAIARLLFQYKVWQTREERERDPILLVCEEAHRYVPNAGLAEYQSAQRAMRRLAKEGRKYGIGLMLVSQRPADVEHTVLSQCSSWIVMRLSNAADQEHVSRFLPHSLAGLSRMLPSLSRQEALFLGEAAAVPARIEIRTLDKSQLPRSADVPFVQGWSQPPVGRDEIARVVARWRRETAAQG